MVSSFGDTIIDLSINSGCTELYLGPHNSIGSASAFIVASPVVQYKPINKNSSL